MATAEEVEVATVEGVEEVMVAVAEAVVEEIIMAPHRL